METLVSTSVPVSEIMCTELQLITEDHKLKDAYKIFKQFHIRHLPVVNNGALVGILSSTDLNRLSFEDVYQGLLKGDNTDDSILHLLKVGDVMHKHPIFIGPSTSLTEAAKILIRADFHALPVLDNGNLVGMVTTTDIIRYLMGESL